MRAESTYENIEGDFFFGVNQMRTDARDPLATTNDEIINASASISTIYGCNTNFTPNFASMLGGTTQKCYFSPAVPNVHGCNSQFLNSSVGPYYLNSTDAMLASTTANLQDVHGYNYLQKLPESVSAPTFYSFSSNLHKTAQTSDDNTHAVQVNNENFVTGDRGESEIFGQNFFGAQLMTKNSVLSGRKDPAMSTDTSNIFINSNSGSFYENGNNVRIATGPSDLGGLMISSSVSQGDQYVSSLPAPLNIDYASRQNIFPFPLSTNISTADSLSQFNGLIRNQKNSNLSPIATPPCSFYEKNGKSQYVFIDSTSPLEYHHQSDSSGRNQKRRIRFNCYQILVLEKAYKECSSPRPAVRLVISLILAISEKTVQIWFQNRRAKDRKFATSTEQSCVSPQQNCRDKPFLSPNEVTFQTVETMHFLQGNPHLFLFFSYMRGRATIPSNITVPPDFRTAAIEHVSSRDFFHQERACEESISQAAREEEAFRNGNALLSSVSESSRLSFPDIPCYIPQPDHVSSVSESALENYVAARDAQATAPNLQTNQEALLHPLPGVCGQQKTHMLLKAAGLQVGNWQSFSAAQSQLFKCVLSIAHSAMYWLIYAGGMAIKVDIPISSVESIEKGGDGTMLQIRLKTQPIVWLYYDNFHAPGSSSTAHEVLLSPTAAAASDGMVLLPSIFNGMNSGTHTSARRGRWIHVDASHPDFLLHRLYAPLEDLQDQLPTFIEAIQFLRSLKTLADGIKHDNNT